MTEPARRANALAAWQRTYADGGGPLAACAVPERGAADAEAAWAHWHRATAAADLDASLRPWYDALEQARVESLAAADLPGMRLNLARRLDQLAGADLATWLYRAARARLADPSGMPPPPPSAASGQGASALRKLAFWRRPDSAPPSPEMLQRLLLETLDAVRDCLADGRRYAEALQPLLAACARYGAAPAVTLPQALVALAANAALPSASAGAELAMAAPAAQGYRVYSTAWDELLGARELAARMPAGGWPALPPADVASRRLAVRLQRRLQAARLRRWSFGEEQGLLDNRRLASALKQGGAERIFRREGEAPQAEACVTLLVDQSGSMRGQPALLAVQAIDLAVAALERCGIRCEVLGFATAEGLDNPLRRAWEAAGRPPAPGRLNAVRHVVYKTCGQPWRQARRQLPWLLDATAGVENIDGEALAWAARRLARQPEARKILLVIGDGAPCDAATREANGASFLDDHLRAVIAAIEAGPIHLAALGAGQNVGRFYARSMTLRAPERIAAQLFEQLAELLDVGGERR